MSVLPETKSIDDGFDEESEYDSEYTYTDYSESNDVSAKVKKSFSDDFSMLVKDESPYSTRKIEEFSKSELEVSESFAEWKKEIMDPSSNIVKKLQDQFGEELPKCKVKADDEPSNIVSLIGERDEDGNIHGEAEIYYDNGDYFWGDFNHGVKEGQASVVLKNGDNYMGVFKENQLDGFVTESIEFCDRDNVTREVFYEHGVRHGYYREIGPLKQFWAIGRFSNGKKIGTHWRWAEGNSFLVGAIDEQNKPHGDFNIYLYPDLTTAMVGHFDHGKMKTGHMVYGYICSKL